MSNQAAINCNVDQCFQWNCSLKYKQRNSHLSLVGEKKVKFSFGRSNVRIARKKAYLCVNSQPYISISFSKTGAAHKWKRFYKSKPTRGLLKNSGIEIYYF